MIKVQTLTLTTLAALLTLGAFSFLTGSWVLFGWTPALCILPMLATAAVAHFKGVLVFPEKEPYQDKS